MGKWRLRETKERRVKQESRDKKGNKLTLQWRERMNEES